MGERRRDRKQRKLTQYQTAMQAQYAQQQWHQTQALLAEQRAQTELLRQAAAASAAAHQPQGGGRWYPDPVGRFAQRWWDGQAWTGHVIDGAGRQTTDPQPVNTVR